MPPRRLAPLALSAAPLLASLAAYPRPSQAFRPSESGGGPYSAVPTVPPSAAAGSDGGARASAQVQEQEQEQVQPPGEPDLGYYGDDPESFEDRAAAWRRYQQEKYEHQTPAQRMSALDEDGRTKLLATVSRGSIAFFFFVLMWRSVHHYELADASFRGIARLVLVVPTVALFVGNMAGCVASVTSPSHSAKKRMKAILNLNKLAEALLFGYNVLRLTAFPSKFVPREIYVGRTLTNFLFLVQCQLFTRVTWGAAQISHEAGLSSAPPPPASDGGYGEAAPGYAGAGAGGLYGYERQQQQPLPSGGGGQRQYVGENDGDWT